MYFFLAKCQSREYYYVLPYVECVGGRKGGGGAIIDGLTLWNSSIR